MYCDLFTVDLIPGTKHLKDDYKQLLYRYNELK